MTTVSVLIISQPHDIQMQAVVEFSFIWCSYGICLPFGQLNWVDSLNFIVIICTGSELTPSLFNFKENIVSYIYADIGYSMNFIMIFKNKIQINIYIYIIKHTLDWSSEHSTLQTHHRYKQANLKENLDSVNTPLQYLQVLLPEIQSTCIFCELINWNYPVTLFYLASL